MQEPPIAYAEMAYDEIESMLKSGLFKRIDTSDWIALVHYVKKEGEVVRVTVDYSEQSHHPFTTASALNFRYFPTCQICKISIKTGPL